MNHVEEVAEQQNCVVPCGNVSGGRFRGYGGGVSAHLSFLTPYHLFQILRKRWLTITLVTGLALCAAVYYLNRAVCLYRSTATIELSTRRPRILNQQAAVIEDPSTMVQAEETINTQIEKFRSSGVLPVVIACYRKLAPQELTPDRELADRLQSSVSFDLMRKTRLVVITVVSSNPAFASHACQAFADGAEAVARSENRSASDAAVTWLETQAEIQKRELEKADRVLLDARQAYSMDALEGERKTVDQALLSFNQALVGVESQLAMERELLSSLECVELKPENAGQMPASIPRAKEVDEALARWMNASSERAALRARYTAEHPESKAMDKVVEQHRIQILNALQTAKSTTASNLELLKRQAEHLRKNKEQQSNRAAILERDILDREMKLSALQRTRAAADASYQGILTRIQEARLSADENTTTVKVVEAASLPSKPFSPQVWKIAICFVCLGMFGGMCLALTVNALEDQIASVDDVEVNSGLRAIAVVPHIRKARRIAAALVSLKNRTGDVSEAFAGLRAVLDSPTYRKQSNVILIASSLPKEGKTTTSVNLAATFAKNGQRVLLIDFDLRRPKIAGIFPKPSGGGGLAEFLFGRSSLPESLAYRTDCYNLWAIASSTACDASPSDLLKGPVIESLFSWARANFDRVIVDSPPVGIVSDSLVLAGLADCVLLVARPSVSRKRVIRHTVSRFIDIGITPMAAVVNDIDFTKSIYHGYGPYYHYQRSSASYLESYDSKSVE